MFQLKIQSDETEGWNQVHVLVHLREAIDSGRLGTLGIDVVVDVVVQVATIL